MFGLRLKLNLDHVVKIYLAGPEVFFSNALEEGHRLKSICAEHGFEGVFPLDGDVNFDGLAQWEMAEAVFDANIQNIEACDAIIANMTPFRGPGVDGGTAFEIGYAYAQGKTVIGWSSDDRDYKDRVREFFSGDLTKDERWRDPQGLEVEDFGQPDNLMMASAVIDVVSSFEALVLLLRKIMNELARQDLN